MMSTMSALKPVKSRRVIAMNCITCLRDISRFRKRGKCLNCMNDQFCKRCMINGWCKNCYTNKKIVCPICDRQVEKKNLCSLCGISFCDQCGIDANCKNCFINDESKKLIQIIYEIRKDISKSSIGIIVDYCIGYIVTCCNKREMCKNTILFQNKYEYLKSDPQRIYRYSPKFNKANTVRIYMNDLRIFCTDCTSNKIQPCLNKHGGNCDKLEICGDNEYGNICGDHEFCTNCNQRELKREYRCPDIHSVTRRWVYYTSPSTTINKCISCKKNFCTDCIKYNKLKMCKTCTELRMLRNSTKTKMKILTTTDHKKPPIYKRSASLSNIDTTTTTTHSANRFIQSPQQQHITTTVPQQPNIMNSRLQPPQQRRAASVDTTKVYNNNIYGLSLEQQHVGHNVHVETSENYNINGFCPLMTLPSNHTMVLPPNNMNTNTRYYNDTCEYSYTFNSQTEPMRCFDEGRDTFRDHTFNELSLCGTDNGTLNQMSLMEYYYSSPNSINSPTTMRDWSYATTPSYNNNSNKTEIDLNNNYISLGDKSGVYDIVNNERRRGSDEYKQECIAKIKIGRAPVISRK